MNKLINRVVIISLLVGLCVCPWYFFFWRPYVSTDNAYVGANYISVAAQVSGIAMQTKVVNNQHVKAGDLLFSIDPAPYLFEVEKLQAQLDLMGNAVREAAATVDQAEAIVAQRAAELQDVEANTTRTFQLVARQVLPAKDRDDAIARLKSAEQALVAAQAQLHNARIHLGKLGADNEQIRYATAGLEQAKLNLSYTRIYAPFDGQVSNSVLISGQYVQAGMTLFALIADAEFWVDANFKETQLNDMRVGQKASIEVDMYSDKKFTGEVVSISGASGTVFSLLPPQNATGNWVKVTQRVPVRIMVKDLDPGFYLTIGTSASVTVKVK